MEGDDAGRVATCGGDSAPPHDNKILNRIMLRFRPIAPKPVAGSSATAAGESHGSNRKAPLQVKRPKRKYVRVRRNSVNVRRNNNDKSPDKSAERNDDVAVVTLQLIPEKEEPEQASLVEDSWCKNVDLDLTVENIQILDNPEPSRVTVNVEPLRGLDPTAEPPPPSAVVVETWVTGTCMGVGQGSEGGGLLGCTDAEKVKSLEIDTCPGFVSDGYFRVRWVNEAFRRMAVSDEEVGDSSLLPEVVILLKVKDNIAAWCCCYSYPAFTCGVRLQYTWRNEKCTKMMPCDVWRLDWGGFAWRLDVKAALSLGL